MACQTAVKICMLKCKMVTIKYLKKCKDYYRYNTYNTESSVLDLHNLKK